MDEKDEKEGKGIGRRKTTKDKTTCYFPLGERRVRGDKKQEERNKKA